MATIKVYITNLGMYNEGKLHGDWVSLPVSNLGEAIKKAAGVAPNTKYEEVFISDYESDCIQISEYENLEKLNEVAEQLLKLDKDGKIILRKIHQHEITINSPEQLEEMIDKVRSGDFILFHETSFEDFAWERLESIYDIQDGIRHLVEINKYVQDIVNEGTFLNCTEDNEEKVIIDIANL